MLEESLESFPGAVILVTHDRHLLDRVCTEVIGLNGDGSVSYFGNSAQWLAARTNAELGSLTDEPAAEARVATATRPAGRKLSYKEKLELERIEAEMAEAEAAQRACQAAADDPAVSSNHVELQNRYAALAAASARVDHLFERWISLATEKNEVGTAPGKNLFPHAQEQY